MATTVLDIVQNVLNLIDGDNVSSITDTIESEQVASLVKHCYNTIVDRYDITAGKSEFQLNSLISTSTPTHFSIPDTVLSIDLVKYDCRQATSDPTAYREITYLTPKDFFHVTQDLRDSSDTTNFQTVLVSNIPIYVKKLSVPQYYTILDDTQVIFDGYDYNQESYLQTGKTACYGTMASVLTVDNTTPINLPQNLIQLLQQETIELAFDLWKEGAPQRVIRDASKARVRAQRRQHRLNIGQEIDKFTGPNYGRNSQRN